MCIRTFDATVLCQQYLGYLTKYYPFQHYIQVRGRGAANQMRIAISSIKEYAFDLPSIECQQRIADILSAYDDLVENNQKQIKLLEEAAQWLYKEWFVNLRFPGYETTPVVDGVPEGWHRGPLKELININYGKDHKNAPDDGDIPVYGSGGLIRKCNKSLFTGEAVLIPRKGSLNHIMYAMNIGAAVPSMTVKILEAMSLLIPSSGTLERFNDIAKMYFQRIAVLKKQNEDLTQARGRLLPKLMSGEIEV